jgi:hypothetical protein
MATQIPIIVKGTSSADLYREFGEPTSRDFSLQLHQASSSERDPLLSDPTILATLMTISYQVIASLVSAVLRASERKIRKPSIMLYGPGGWQLEIPAETPSEEILKLIEGAKRMDIEEIRVQPRK